MINRRVIVGITGASGVIYGIRTLEALKAVGDIESHLVLSPSAARTLVEETSYTPDDVRSLASVVHSHGNIGASIASGSFRTAGMVVAPCSIKTLSAVANCYAEDLISRAADVCLKERRPLILMIRETPLHIRHAQLMEQAMLAGAIIAPPVPAFYHRPQTIDDIIDQTVGRTLDLLGIDTHQVVRWSGSALRHLTR
ncbi:UbiX family flavin prenyltransferase [Aliihoeflea sp. PC F10.4]